MDTMVRQRMLSAMNLLLEEEPLVHYRRYRPMATRPLINMTLLSRAIHSPAGISVDCSEIITLICRIAGTSDPNGRSFDGYGNTGTMLAHLPHYSNPAFAFIGGIVIFGDQGGTHAAMVYERHPTNPLLFSHGMERGPILIRLADERKYHVGEPVTFLSVAGL